MPFLREICEDVGPDRNGNLVECKSRATNLLDENEFVRLCDKHYKEWIVIRKRAEIKERAKAELDQY